MRQNTGISAGDGGGVTAAPGLTVPASLLAGSTRKALLTGVAQPAVSAFAAEFVRHFGDGAHILVCPDRKTAESILDDLSLFLDLGEPGRAIEPVLLPERNVEAGNREFDVEIDRLSALNRLRHFSLEEDEESLLVVATTPLGLLQETPSAETLAARELFLRVGGSYPFGELVECLREFNYDSEVVCESPGEYAVRGGIIDIYPVTSNQPYRLDFFGDQLEEIRAFDPATQRSEEAEDSLRITAAPSALETGRPGSVTEFLGARVNWTLVDPSALDEGIASYLKRAEEGGLVHSLEGLQRIRERHGDRWLGLSDLDLDTRLFDKDAARHACATEPLSSYRTYPDASRLGEERLFGEQEARRKFFRQLVRWQKGNYGIVLVTNNDGEEQRLKEILAEEETTRALEPMFLRGRLNEGFRISFEEAPLLAWPAFRGRGGVVVVSDSEIFGRCRQRRTIRRGRATVNRSQVDQMLDFSELAEGDHLVHVQHGVCVFREIGKIETRGQIREVITVEFAEGVLLHVPLHESHLLSRYVGLAKSRPMLGKIGSRHWEKTRRAAELGALDLAADLLGLQAKRDALPGFSHTPDTAWQTEFENAFIYEETPDQATVIEETKRDMERPRPMDRLLCGDVGFGKTEVAIRAAFKAVMSGKQVAILAPTTVLTQQHFRTFTERMADYPVVVEMISRFRTPAQRKTIVQGLRTGAIDIVVGTHALFGKEVKFADLGLLVIDEEHRFGVRQKERLKRLRENVDVLSMSATPIPRTLYLALTGARDLSVIETPPADRLPVKTFVRHYDDQLVADAIHRELRRGGQIFYLHNRIDSIEAVALRIQQLAPDARIAIGHGQMGEHRLERIMTDFVDCRYDVLVCTTIIESGIDIPNCNTIIIEAANRFGLAQLYQIRGRVGRFRHQAYAYLLLQRHGRVLDLARKRLAALRQNTQLGAGFRIAMRDLELRGAGNLLGAAQSGHIAGVGFDLYCQLLRQSIARLKGEEEAVAIRANVKLDFVYFGEGREEERARYEDRYTVLKRAEIEAAGECPPIQARIPDAYIPETRLRIDFYRQLAMADKLANVDEIEAGMADRFGEPPEPVQALLLATRIRCAAEAAGVGSVETEGPLLRCLRASGIKDDYIKSGNRFPRLTASKPLLRLKEVLTFLKRISFD